MRCVTKNFYFCPLIIPTKCPSVVLLVLGILGAMALSGGIIGFGAQPSRNWWVINSLRVLKNLGEVGSITLTGSGLVTLLVTGYILREGFCRSKKEAATLQSAAISSAPIPNSLPSEMPTSSSTATTLASTLPSPASVATRLQQRPLIIDSTEIEETKRILALLPEKFVMSLRNRYWYSGPVIWTCIIHVTENDKNSIFLEINQGPVGENVINILKCENTVVAKCALLETLKTKQFFTFEGNSESFFNNVNEAKKWLFPKIHALPFSNDELPLDDPLPFDANKNEFVCFPFYSGATLVYSKKVQETQKMDVITDCNYKDTKQYKELMHSHTLVSIEEIVQRNQLQG